MLKTLAPEKKIKRLLTGKLTIKKAALSFLDDADFIDKDDVIDSALKVAKSYRERFEAGEILKSALKADPLQLIQRIQNLIVFQTSQAISQKYNGERARWLPSDADEPRPEHQLNYGQEYTIGEGIDGVEPGDEYGCQCGVEILVDETQLSL